MRLDGKSAIVTGAASGIGLATARLFADEGANVLAVDLPSSRLVEEHKGSDRIATRTADIAQDGAAGRSLAKRSSGSGASTCS